MVPSPQVPTRESRGDGGDVPKTGWREETFAATLASQSALGWGDSLLSVVGRCLGDHSALGWGDSLLSVTGRCPGESVRAWLGTVAMWRCGRCMASQSMLDWGGSLMSIVGRCPGESAMLDWGLSLCGESVRA
ncbi:hypothetical protein ACLB2K_007433 [Fragaria x ananassa]